MILCQIGVIPNDPIMIIFVSNFFSEMFLLVTIQVTATRLTISDYFCILRQTVTIPHGSWISHSLCQMTYQTPTKKSFGVKIKISPTGCIVS